MQRTQLGRTGLSVSRLCLGTMTFGLQCEEAAQPLDPGHRRGGRDRLPRHRRRLSAGRRRQHRRAHRGDRRQLAGRQAPRLHRRHQVRRPHGPQALGPGHERKHILDAIDASLKRLKTDYVDLYQLHSYDPTTPIDEALEALDAVVKSGKARYVGVSNWPAYKVARAVGRAELKGWAGITSAAAALQPAVPHLRARPAAALPRGGDRRHPLQSAGRRHAHRQAHARPAAGRAPASPSARPARATRSATGTSASSRRSRR